jgi:2-oxoglutarate dehydrogenase E2 component (dihydrolipoamide succinyltransferase)
MTARTPDPAAPPPSVPAEEGRTLEREVRAVLENLASDDDLAERGEAWAAPPDPTEGHPWLPQLAVEEIDFSLPIGLCTRWAAAFEARHELRLDPWALLVKAVASALSEVPEANVQISQGRAQRTGCFDVAVTLSGRQGLRTPVLRDALRMGVPTVAAELARFAREVAEGVLPPASETGAVITLHDRQDSGLLLSTAPLIPPQCLALVVHAVRPRPTALPGPGGPTLAVRPLCPVALTWDPRAMSAATAARFLRRVREVMEHPERLLIEA